MPRRKWIITVVGEDRIEDDDTAIRSMTAWIRGWFHPLTTKSIEVKMERIEEEGEEEDDITGEEGNDRLR